MYLDALTSQNCLAGLPGYPLLPRIPLPLSPLPFSHALLLSAAGAMDEVERTGRGGSPSRSRRWCPPARRVAPGGSEKLATTDRRRRELGGEAGPGREAPAAEISGGNRSGGSNAGIHAAACRASPDPPWARPLERDRADEDRLVPARLRARLARQ